MLNNTFIYAAGYYPLMHEKEDWNRDLKLMSEAGIKLIRTAELFNTWDRIEPSKGNFEFDFLDNFFDLCLKYDMKILLGTGTAAPPYWIHEMYEDVNILNNHDEQYPNNVSYSWACIDHVGYLKEVKRYVTILVNRYKNHEALYAYQIHNEISFPFMPLKDGDIDIYCYCNHSKQNFRKWIENKYKTLDNLNYAYRWGATNTCHTSFKQVEPPKTKPTSWSSVTRWLDWRLFWMENIVNFVKMQNELIKTLDLNHPTSTNIFFLKSQDPLGVITALDQFEMAKVVDIIGYDLYPGSGDKLESKPEFSSMFLDMSRSTAESIGKDYWLMETESGPINGWVLGPSRNVKGFDLIRNIYEAVGHDAKMSLYQGWREWDFQPLHWGAIVDLDGNETERTKAAVKLGNWLNKDGELYKKAKTPAAKIALLISKENAIVLNGMGQEKFLVDSIRGAYRIFWEMNFKVDFITPELMKNGFANQYDLIYMPFMTIIDESLSTFLSDYVKQGGRLIAGARSGMLGQYGWYNHSLPCFTLKDVFGIEVLEVEAKTNPDITIGMTKYKGYWHKEIIQVNDTVEIIGRFNDEKPAVTKNRFGDGYGIYIATHGDVAYLEEDSSLLKTIIHQLLEEGNIKPYVEIEYTNPYIKEVDAHLLETEGKGLLIITNYVPKTHSDFFVSGEKKVRLKLNTKRKYTMIQNLHTGAIIDGFNSDSLSWFEITIKDKETMVLELK